ncbi:hypothetical protein AMAG_13662 [Allomyces macrogynus ATCC 38327]|uniref:Uncharacterized protein n=1 Tax=Allomyces macrogynus (strain ATCC 38327) TaxID=578462 RepID=A0A0L0T3I9_ALLM3|nr:hypothetical protein AMAG_13662 [Allomyces macrogynus ATCC 38327]|eukprot:KNE69281.1 hypothetical protein AMAG_13662 [Allomyces macrogynus ATCC 38327]
MPATDPWPKGTLASHSSATIDAPGTLTATANYRLSQSTSLLTPPSTMPRTRHAAAGTGAHPAHAGMVARVARLVNVAQELYHESTIPPPAPTTTDAKYAKWKQIATEKSAGVAVCVRKVKDPAAKRARSVRVPWFAGKKSVHQMAATASTVSSESDAATVSVAQDLLTRPPVAVRARGEVPVGVGEVLRLLVRPEDSKYNLLHEGELPVTLSIFKKSHRRRHRVEVIHSIGNCVYLCTTALSPQPPTTSSPVKDKRDDPSDLVTLAWVLAPVSTDTTHTDVCLLAYGDADAAHGAKPAAVLKECRKSAGLAGVLAKYIRKHAAKLNLTDAAAPEDPVSPTVATARPMTWAVPVEDDETTAGPPVHDDDLAAFPLVHRLLMHHQHDGAYAPHTLAAPGAASAPTSPPRMKRAAAAADARTDAATPARILSIARNRNESLSSNRLLVRVTRSYSDSLIQYPMPPPAPTAAARAQQHLQSHEEVPVGGDSDDEAKRAHHEHQQAALKSLGTLDPRVVAIALATALMAVRYGLVGA